MKNRKLVFAALSLLVIGSATIGTSSLASHAAAGGAHCGRGIKSCNAAQVGQPCDAKNPGVICSAQADGSYCCLAVAP
jgi:hypothetical protein